MPNDPFIITAWVAAYLLVGVFITTMSRAMGNETGTPVGAGSVLLTLFWPVVALIVSILVVLEIIARAGTILGVVLEKFLLR